MKTKKQKQTNRPEIPEIKTIESLDAHTCEIIRLRAACTAQLAEMEARVAEVQKDYAKPIGDLIEQIAALETAVECYCRSNRSAIFTDKKSRETLTAVVGFEFTPHRVETEGRKVTWKLVCQSLLGLVWGKDYVRNPEPQVDKDKLLADRATLTPQQLAAAGIRFAQDENFYIRTKTPEAA